jgi:hypothetical protein
MKNFQDKYGPSEGAYWWAVANYQGCGHPHRVHSEVDLKKGLIILRDVNDEDLIRIDLSTLEKKEVKSAKSSKRTSKSKGKRTNPKPEQLENSSD